MSGKMGARKGHLRTIGERWEKVWEERKKLGKERGKVWQAKNGVNHRAFESVQVCVLISDFRSFLKCKIQLEPFEFAPANSITFVNNIVIIKVTIFVRSSTHATGPPHVLHFFKRTFPVSISFRAATDLFCSFSSSRTSWFDANAFSRS